MAGESACEACERRSPGLSGGGCLEGHSWGGARLRGEHRGRRRRVDEPQDVQVEVSLDPAIPVWSNTDGS